MRKQRVSFIKPREYDYEIPHKELKKKLRIPKQEDILLAFSTDTDVVIRVEDKLK